MRFLLASIVSAALVLSAPFIGLARSTLRSAFPGQFVVIVGGAIALAIGVALVAVFLRIRERRASRYAAVIAALAIGVLYSVATRTGNPEVDAVQQFHFVEYGLVTFLFYRAWRPLGDASVFILPVLAGLLVGTVEEWFQWFIPVRVGEVNDVFLNLVAIGCGLLFAFAVDPPPAPPKGGWHLAWKGASHLSGGTARRRVGLFAAVVLIAFAAFFHALHLGYEIVDAEAGTFRSRYTAGELRGLSTDRAARWRAAPPLTLRRLSREDQYMTEGVSHVQRRNVAWGEGNAPAAWAENRILEKYYEPVLDAPSYVSRTGHRWPPEQRADAERRARDGTPPPYVSDAYPYRLFTWPRPLYWAIVLAMAAALLLPAFAAARTPRHPAGC